MEVRIVNRKRNKQKHKHFSRNNDTNIKTFRAKENEINFLLKKDS